ncbi:MAG: hypothetical protein WCO06_00455 [Candidatus Roizmanbacteria bacterium]
MNQKELLVVSIGIFLTVVSWMVIDLYHKQSQSQRDLEIRTATIPKYSIDDTVFYELKRRKI